MLLMHMDLLSAWTAASEPDLVEYWNILCFNIRQVNYQGHIIPVIIAIWLMCKVEKWLHRHVPEMIDFFVTPLITLLVTAFLTMTIIGPAFIVVENNILAVVTALLKLPLGIGAMICGAVYPLTVVCGIHHMFNVLEAGMIAESGMNVWLPVSCSANFAMCMSCVAVFAKAKNIKTKSLALPAGLSASLGITEPAIFGINLRFVKPLICEMAGAAIGAAAGSLMGVYGSAYGVTGIPGFLITTDCTLEYTIMLLISGAVAFVLTYFLWSEESLEAKKSEESLEAKKSEENSGAKEQKKDAEEMSNDQENSSGSDMVICAPLQGKVISREEIPDDTFASGVLGDGVGIEPLKGEVTAPFDGVVSSVTDTKHAVGLTGPENMELLIHVGIDTVNMKGDGFELLVAEDEQVKKGQPLIRFDMEKIKSVGYSTTTAVLLTNSDDYENFQIIKKGMTEAGEPLIQI